MAAVYQSPSSGAISMLNLYRSCAQDSTGVPPSGFSLADVNVARLIPNEAVWNNPVSTRSLADFYGVKIMWLKYTVGYVPNGSVANYGYNMVSKLAYIYPMGSGPTNHTYRFKADAWASLPIGAVFIGLYNTIKSFWVVLDGDMRSLGNVTLYFANGASFTLTSIQFDSTRQITTWTANFTRGTDDPYLITVGNTVYCGVSFAND